MRWFKRKRRAVAAADAVAQDGVTPNRYSAYWWVPGCTCHWSAGIDADYCDFCKAGRPSVNSTPPGAELDSGDRS